MILMEVDNQKNCGFAGYQRFSYGFQLKTSETVTAVNVGRRAFSFSATLVRLLDDE